MDKKEQILHYYRVDGLSLREISRRVGLNRKTVTRYVREFERISLEDGEDGIERCLQQKPFILLVVNPSVRVLQMLYVMRLTIGWKRMPVVG